MIETFSRAFNRAFEIVIGHEGGYTNDPRDTGNWTGGAVNSGELKGTKYGISAASYPHLDIANLTLDDAREIYKRDYWDAIQADYMSPSLALLVFDAAVNNGVGRAKQWLTAAPELLKALRHCLVRFERCLEYAGNDPETAAAGVERYRALITKIEGDAP